MKKNLRTLAILICAAFTLCFTQCTKSPENLIIGSWILEYTETTTTYDDQTQINHQTPDEGEQVVFTFNKDLSLVMEDTKVENGNTHVTTSRGSYLITDNTITMTSEDEGDEPVTYNIDLLDKKEMTLSMTQTGTSLGHTITVTAKIQMKRK